MHRTIRLLALGAWLACTATAGRAEIITIDSSTVGTVYDGILDGVAPFPPPGEAPDGDGDSQMTGLAVALKMGAVEERGVAEFPLSPLSGLTAADIDTATLTFNIDDVISTFWPGADFDGTAAASIVVFAYSGDGTVDLPDFENVAGAPAGVVDTTPLGTITDTTLGTTGPLQFDVDITARLQTLLTGGATHIGIVFVTNDNNSATSIDDLGLGAAGPPGVGGAIMPLLTIVTVPDVPPVFDTAELNCQKAISKGGAGLAKTAHKALKKCLDRVLAATAKEQPLGGVTAKCDGDLDPSDSASKVGKAMGKLQAGIADKCGSLTPAELGSPCDSDATTFTEVADCLVEQHLSSVGEAIDAEYGSACALISAVGLDMAYPALCD